MYPRHVPNLANMKAEARRYRAIKESQGKQVSHSRALELIARKHGFFDWNTAAAHARHFPTPKGLEAGQHVAGRYMGHAFEARVVASTQLSQEEVYLSLDLWDPVDVVESAGFSNMRRRITGRIGADGRSPESLSNGMPHLEVAEETRSAKL